MKTFTFKNFNIADWFSFYRVIAAPILLALIWLDYRVFFAIALLISYLTDAIDGFLARRLKITSPRGSQLDSFGDQITMAVAIIGIYVFRKAFIQEHLMLIAVGFTPYIIQMLIAYLKYEKATAFHTYLAKTSAVIQCGFMVIAILFEPLNWLFYLMIIIGLLETLEEITLIFMYDTWVRDVKGVFWALKDKRRAPSQKTITDS